MTDIETMVQIKEWRALATQQRHFAELPAYAAVRHDCLEEADRYDQEADIAERNLNSENQ